MMMTAARMPRFGSKRVLTGVIYVYLIAAAGNAAHIAAAVTTVPRVFATAAAVAAPATVTTTARRTGTAAGITRITHKITSVVKIYGARERTPYCILCVYF